MSQGRSSAWKCSDVFLEAACSGVTVISAAGLKKKKKHIQKLAMHIIHHNEFTTAVIPLADAFI